MSRNHKVKRYYGKSSSSYRAKPRLITIILIVVLFAGLGYLGTVLYNPAYNFLMNIGKEAPMPEPEPVIAPGDDLTASPAVTESVSPASKFDKLKAVYIPFETASSPEKLDEFLAQLSGTQINAVMVDLKSPVGEVLFKTSNEMAAEWGIINPNAIDLKELAKVLEDKNLMLAAKMPVFKDHRAASAGRLNYAINYRDSSYLWLDAAPEDGGRPWLNPYSTLTQDYIGSLLTEALDAGAKFIALENVQFPDNSGVYASFGKDAADISRAEILKAFITDWDEKAEEKHARIAVCFSAADATRAEGQENRYGGPILDIPEEYLLLNVSPSQYGTDFSAGGLEITGPLEEPGKAVTDSINYVKQGIPAKTTIIPMLQGGNDGAFNRAEQYAHEQIAEQISAAEALGLNEYVLFNAEGEYLLK